MITLRVKNLPLTSPPQETDAAGFAVFYLNQDKVDWTDSCNAAFRQIHGDKKTPESDRRYEEVMRARREAAKVNA